MCSSILLVACSTSILVPTRNYQPPRSYTHVPVEPAASIKSTIPYVFVDGVELRANVTQSIETGTRRVLFDGPVYLDMPTEALIEASDEQTAAVIIGSCVAALPLCPLSIALIKAVSSDTERIEAKCKATFSFVAGVDEKYVIRMVKEEGIFPEFRIINSYDTVLANEVVRCELSDD